MTARDKSFNLGSLLMALSTDARKVRNLQRRGRTRAPERPSQTIHKSTSGIRGRNSLTLERKRAWGSKPEEARTDACVIAALIAASFAAAATCEPG